MRELQRAFLMLSIFALAILYRRYVVERQPLNIITGASDARTRWRSLGMGPEQCAVEFPGLQKEIENAIAEGAFPLRKADDDVPGSIQGRIKDGKVGTDTGVKLYIISAGQDNVLRRTGAILHSLHRAIITSPTPLPDTVFAISINDVPRANTWSFVRSDDEFTPHTPWLMPHFSSWSWPLEYVGPLDQALAKIDEYETLVRWEDKVDKAIWRGTPWFNPDWAMGLRPKLVDASEGREWADVQLWGQGRDPANTLNIDEFCRYRYIIYAEGKTYSGRLPYHQACASIILTPPPTFLLHTTHLLRPVFSSVLLSGRHPSTPTEPPAAAYPLPATARTWPLSYPAGAANVVFVRPDWSDLEATILWLRAHPDVAGGIARRQRALVVEGGYLSEAAEACYWRALIRAWSRLAKVEGEWGEGMRWETFSLLGKASFG